MATLDEPIEGFADLKVKQGNTDITLHSYKYPAKTPETKAVNLLFHGYSEYLKCALRPYATSLAEKGICSVGIDQRGFGFSQGVRGYLESFNDIISDSKRFLELLKERDPLLRDKPLLLTGLSMGGASCLHFSLKEPDLVKGMIMFSPAIGLMKKNVRGSTLYPMLKPVLKPFREYGLFDFPHQILSDNQDILDILVKDPVVYKGKFPIGSVLEFIRSENYLLKNADKLKTPFILFQGDDDRIVDPEIVRKFCEKTTAVKNKKIVMIPKGDHLLLLNPTTIGEMQGQISTWLSQII